LERLTTVAPFGFRFWDPLEHRSIAAGLHVRHRWEGAPERPVTCSSSGVFGIRGLPGFRAFETGTGDDAFWADPPHTPGTGTVFVDDPLGRFLPIRFQVDEPVRLGAAFREVCRLGHDGSPPDAAMSLVPLFSAPGRARPAGMALVTAQLELVDGSPARGALLEVRANGQPPAIGMADRNGIAVVMFPYPEPEDVLLSPPPASMRSLSTQTWEVGIAAFYVADAVADDHPDLCAVLDQRSRPAVLLADDSPVVALSTASLEYGRPLILRTAGRSELVLDPG
jgi:hypothetical protein